MRFRRRTPLYLAAFLLLVAGATTIVAKKSPPIERRARALGSKLIGRLPYVSWGELSLAIIPSELRGELRYTENNIRQVNRGESPCSVLWKTPRGLYWGRLADRYPLAVALTYREIDNRYLRGPLAIRRGDVVLDGGSHLGTFTRFALEQGAGLVVAFEPDPETMVCFRRNFEEEIHARQVIPIESALWSKAGDSLIFEDSADSLDSAIQRDSVKRSGAARTVRVSTITIDEAVRLLHLNRVDFIKLNIEGAEREALKGALGTIARFRPKMKVSLEHLPDDPWVVPQTVLEAVPSYRVSTQLLKQSFFYCYW
ncbi:MAG TPA: FkbM family methyltransferase [Acidobacteriota bacterium]|nr:FkbM family methyltransferase [Acidobacteriota bacterium]